MSVVLEMSVKLKQQCTIIRIQNPTTSQNLTDIDQRKAENKIPIGIAKRSHIRILYPIVTSSQTFQKQIT